MKDSTAITWDYSGLAGSYSGRPPYATAVVADIVSMSGVTGRACDIGAGTAHLTVELLAHGLAVDAVEPNVAMREIGRERTRDAAATWFDATAEATGRPDAHYALVTFGSSFNVVEREPALREAARILRSDGWVACMWNHRDLDDPLQAQIERVIRSYVPNYDYGYRRRETAPRELARSALFGELHKLETSVRHEVAADRWADGWRSHATLARQAGDQTERIVGEIAALVEQAQTDNVLEVPYTTRGWLAQKRSP